jgi:ABC-type nitrate/sulfonate/bicarbonate transport system permease component
VSKTNYPYGIILIKGDDIIKYLKFSLVLLVIILIWLLSSNYMSPLFLPKPLLVLKNFIILTTNGQLFKALAKSFTRITLATILSVAVSLPVALVLIRYRLVSEIVTPITNILRYLPITAFYPLLILWVGINEQMKIIFLFLATFFYFLPTILLTIKDMDKSLIEEASVSGMTEWQLILGIVLPCSLPSICQSILVMYGIGWTYIPIAETINANVGLGFIINTSSSRGRTDMVFIAIITIAIISWIIDTIGQKIIRKAFTWKYD